MTILGASMVLALLYALHAAGIGSGGGGASGSGRTVTYIVTGSPATVNYGPAGSDLGGTVPMNVSARLGYAAYYAISAQLQGDGQVQCEILVGGAVISQATATSSYGIADCEITRNVLTGNWEDANSR